MVHGTIDQNIEPRNKLTHFGQLVFWQRYHQRHGGLRVNLLLVMNLILECQGLIPRSAVILVFCSCMPWKQQVISEVIGPWHPHRSSALVPFSYLQLQTGPALAVRRILEMNQQRRALSVSLPLKLIKQLKRKQIPRKLDARKDKFLQ